MEKAISENSANQAYLSDWVRERDAVKELHVSRSTLNRWVKQGLVAAHYLSERIKIYSRKDLVELFKRRLTQHSSSRGAANG